MHRIEDNARLKCRFHQSYVPISAARNSRKTVRVRSEKNSQVEIEAGEGGSTCPPPITRLMITPCRSYRKGARCALHRVIHARDDLICAKTYSRHNHLALRCSAMRGPNVARYRVLVATPDGYLPLSCPAKAAEQDVASGGRHTLPELLTSVLPAAAVARRGSYTSARRRAESAESHGTAS